MKIRTGAAIAIAATLLAPTALTSAANAATPLHRDRSVSALVAAVQRALPDAQFWGTDQHQISVAESIALTGFNLPNVAVTIDGQYAGQEISRGSERACVLPNPLQLEPRWIAVSGSCSSYLNKNARGVASTINLRVVYYASETIAKYARLIAAGEGRAARLSDIREAAELNPPIDYRVTVTKSSVVVTSTATPNRSATLTIVGGKVKVRTR